MGQDLGFPSQASVHEEASERQLSRSPSDSLSRAWAVVPMAGSSVQSWPISRWSEALIGSPGSLYDKIRRTNELLLHKFCVFGRIILSKPEEADERDS